MLANDCPYMVEDPIHSMYNFEAVCLILISFCSYIKTSSLYFVCSLIETLVGVSLESPICYVLF